MKCVCPMGGDRTCPDDCPLAVWASLSLTDRKAQRKVIVEQLKKQGFAESQIAVQLGVHLATVYRDLQFSHHAKIKPAKTARNPKGAGRPKSNGQHRPRQTEPVKAEIIAQSDDGVPATKIAVDVGLKPRAVQLELQMEHIRREAQAELLDAAAAEKFSDKGKLTIEDAIRIHQKRLNKQFEQRVNEAVRRRIDAANDAMRTNYSRLSQENLNLTRIVSQRGVFTETQFKQMLMLCHPDSSASPQTKAELLQVLVANKMRLVKQ